ncbi:MAG: O-antigen polysaccharide polymerase Wzy [Flavobacterium sp.]|nr:MAG: O-antigen polysaccharide polymerase Wzy [Flavobacterium sp.]
MLVRGGELKELSVEGNMTNLLILRFLMPISVVCFIVYYLSEKRSLIILFFLLILMLITACPTGISRNTTAGLYIPVLLTCFAIFKRRNFFILSFLFAILILFPLLNQFRTFNSDDGLSFTPDFSMFIEGHFDSYPNFALIINSEIVTYGIQLLGVLFFWIPRSIWPGKPISSGIFLSEKANLNFENISVNYFAEGYLNFGFVGLFIFLVILAFTLARIDKIYWRYTVQYKSNFFNVIYLICLGMLFFVLRGDLMSSFAYTLGMLFSSIFVFKFVKK